MGPTYEIAAKCKLFRTRLSADPVAKTYSLNGLKPKQLTSAVWTVQLSTTPACQTLLQYN